MAVKIQLRRDIATNWQTANPILAQGELGIDLTNKTFKIGDGVKHWNNLDAFAGAEWGKILGTMDDQADLKEKFDAIDDHLDTLDGSMSTAEVNIGNLQTGLTNEATARSEADTALGGRLDTVEADKADKSTTYTKTEVNTELGKKQNTLVTENVASKITYTASSGYTITETYAKKYGNVLSVGLKIVGNLTAGEEKTVLSALKYNGVTISNYVGNTHFPVSIADHYSAGRQLSGYINTNGNLWIGTNTTANNTSIVVSFTVIL